MKCCWCILSNGGRGLHPFVIFSFCTFLLFGFYFFLVSCSFFFLVVLLPYITGEVLDYICFYFFVYNFMFVVLYFDLFPFFFQCCYYSCSYIDFLGKLLSYFTLIFVIYSIVWFFCVCFFYDKFQNEIKVFLISFLFFIPYQFLSIPIL